MVVVDPSHDVYKRCPSLRTRLDGNANADGVLVAHPEPEHGYLTESEYAALKKADKLTKAQAVMELAKAGWLNDIAIP